MQRQLMHAFSGHGVENGRQVMVSSLVNNSLFLWMLSMQRPFKYLIPILVTILQLSTQDKNSTSPFKTHPTNMWIFLVATFIYYFTVQLKAPVDNIIYFDRSIIVATVSGSLSAVSLVSMFLPGWFGYLVFIPWALLPIIVLYQIHYVLIHHACHRLQQMIIKIVSKLSGNSSEQPRLPV